MSDKLIHHISGEFVTKFARDKYKETRSLKQAVSLLTQMLIGFPEDLAEQVIKGSKKLVGDNEVYIEDDDAVVTPYGAPQTVDISGVQCGWISPDGELVYGAKNHTSTQEHDDIAQELVEYGIVEDNHRSAYSSLEDAGWVKFSPEYVWCRKRPTDPSLVQHLILCWMIDRDIKSVNLGCSIGNRCFSISQIKRMESDDFALRIIGM